MGFSKPFSSLNQFRESFCESGEGVRLHGDRADLRGSPGNFRGSPGNFPEARGSLTLSQRLAKFVSSF